MPAQPTWFPRLTQILADVRALDVAYLDRQAFEQLFRVQDRRARTLIRQFGGDTRIGNAWAIQRERHIEALQAIQRGDDFEWDHRRRRRVAEVLEQARREHPAEAGRDPRAGRDPFPHARFPALGHSDRPRRTAHPVRDVGRIAHSPC